MVMNELYVSYCFCQRRSHRLIFSIASFRSFCFFDFSPPVWLLILASVVAGLVDSSSSLVPLSILLLRFSTTCLSRSHTHTSHHGAAPSDGCRCPAATQQHGARAAAARRSDWRRVEKDDCRGESGWNPMTTIPWHTAAPNCCGKPWILVVAERTRQALRLTVTPFAMAVSSSGCYSCFRTLMMTSDHRTTRR